MIYKDFQGSKLSALGMGMMRLPIIDGKDDQVDETAAAEVIDYAYHHGINYFDTAWDYHGGNSEWVAGRLLLKYPRDSFYLSSKFPGWDLPNMSKAPEIFEKQLEKCQTPYFDFYLIHNVNETNIDAYLDRSFGVMDYFAAQKRQGRIRHLGFSCHGSVEVLKRFLDAYGEYMEFCQLQLNYMDWHLQEDDKKVELLRQRGIPIWVMEPLRGGKLAKTSQENEALLKARRPQESVAAWAFRFLQAIPEVTMILSGMTTMEALKANLETFSSEKPLTKEEFAFIVDLADQEVKKGGVPCTACRYCISHCPQGLPIPELMAQYNDEKVSGGSWTLPLAVKSLPEDKQPKSCIGCRGCEMACPQQIKISQVMKELAEILNK